MLLVSSLDPSAHGNIASLELPQFVIAGYKFIYNNTANTPDEGRSQQPKDWLTVPTAPGVNAPEH